MSEKTPEQDLEDVKGNVLQNKGFVISKNGSMVLLQHALNAVKKAREEEWEKIKEDNSTLILWAQEVAEEATAKKIFEEIEFLCLGSDKKDLKVFPNALGFTSLKARFLKEKEKK